MQISPFKVKLAVSHHLQQVRNEVYGALPSLETTFIHSWLDVTSRKRGLCEPQKTRIIGTPHELNSDVEELTAPEGYVI